MITFAMIGFINLCAQETDSIPEGSYSKGVSITPIPVIAANPTLGIVFGVTSSFSWTMGNPKNTSPSVAVGSLTYTTNNQFISYLRGNAFLSEDSWNLLTDLRFQVTSQPTYGLGTGSRSNTLLVDGSEGDVNINNPYKKTPSRQMMEYNFFRLYQTFLKRYQDTRLFLGLGYHLDMFSSIDDHLLDLESDPNRITHHYAYNTSKGISTKSYALSGISLNALFDSRDNTANPYKGRYAMINWRVNPKFIGSTTTNTILWTEYRGYFNLSEERPRNLIAVWLYGNFVTSGDVPYMNLPALGWDTASRSGRAYTFGRFRGEDLVYLESEYRFPLQKDKDKWGGVVFINAVSASSRTEDVNLFSHINLAGGVGLRYMLNEKARTNLTLDYGWGTNGSQGFFLGLNEAF